MRPRRYRRSRSVARPIPRASSLRSNCASVVRYSAANSGPTGESGVSPRQRSQAPAPTRGLRSCGVFVLPASPVAGNEAQNASSNCEYVIALPSVDVLLGLNIARFSVISEGTVAQGQALLRRAFPVMTLECKYLRRKLLF